MKRPRRNVNFSRNSLESAARDELGFYLQFPLLHLYVRAFKFSNISFFHFSL